MFLAEPPDSPAQQAAYADDRADSGYVDNLTRLWCWRPDVLAQYQELIRTLTGASALSLRDRAVLVAATARARGDAYCSLAWGTRLAAEAGDDIATAVLTARTAELDARERALAEWAAAVVLDPNRIAGEAVDVLRRTGFGDREIFEVTAFVAFRLAFATVNDALGAAPDAQLAARTPAAVRTVVDYGRAPSTVPST
jgi:uncharacterized peroxidase-related enzyme